MTQFGSWSGDLHVRRQRTPKAPARECAADLRLCSHIQKVDESFRVTNLEKRQKDTCIFFSCNGMVMKMPRGLVCESRTLVMIY